MRSNIAGTACDKYVHTLTITVLFLKIGVIYVKITYIGAKNRESSKIVEEIRERGHDVSYFNLDSSPVGNGENICPTSPADYIKVLRKASSSDVFFGYAMPIPGLLAACLKARYSDSALVISYTGVSWRDYRRGNVLFTKFYPIKRAVIPPSERLLWRFSDGIACLSPWVCDEFRTENPRHADKTGYFTGVIDPAYVREMASQEDFEYVNDRNVILVSNFNFKGKLQGAKILMDAFESVDATLHILGGGQYADEVEKYADSLSYSQKINLWGYVERPEPMIRAADIMAYCSFEDAYSRPPLEAQSLNVPAVVSNTCSIGETVNDGVTGHVVPPEPKAFREKINWLLEHEEERVEMGKRGPSFIESNFNRKRAADKLIEIFENAVE